MELIEFNLIEVGEIDFDIETGEEGDFRKVLVVGFEVDFTRVQEEQVSDQRVFAEAQFHFLRLDKHAVFHFGNKV